MQVLEVVIVIVAIAVLGEILKRYLQARTSDSAKLEELSVKVDKLLQMEQRVQALEVIVTDKKHNLKQEIDDL